MMKIGAIQIERPIFLAPMAGVTDRPFRLLCREMGCGPMVTEMISAKALYYKNKNTAELLRRAPEESPLGVQLFGSDPELMAEMAASIEDNYEFVDVNMGCPVPKVVNNGEGSALMRQPERVTEIVSAMSRRLKKPLTVKIRSGFDETHINAVEIAKRIEAAGASAIAVHGRTRSQYYSGHADWNVIRQVKEAVRIPVIANGDVFSAADAVRMREETGCDGVMIARGARGNPWIFREITAAFSGYPVPPRPSWREVAETVLRHGRMLVEEKGERTGMREMRKHVAWYTAGAPHSSALRARSNTLAAFSDLEEMTEEFVRRQDRG